MAFCNLKEPMLDRSTSLISVKKPLPVVILSLSEWRGLNLQTEEDCCMHARSYEEGKKSCPLKADRTDGI
jgi:hypothetical protein